MSDSEGEESPLIEPVRRLDFTIMMGGTTVMRKGAFFIGYQKVQAPACMGCLGTWPARKHFLVAYKTTMCFECWKSSLEVK